MTEKKQDVSSKVEKVQHSISGIGNLSPQNLKPTSSAPSSKDSDKTQGGQESSGGCKDKK